ncbi:hypothetical protein K443DRAFT_632620 [Laccaria amethystina LaAM-08-1]|uniref:Uncharacterized protein n=1 Tax=Laccaria amethystina LaAM-08-1 TaxID=1095629 RepID=A0A0C9WWW6_9AGAR|nr:hypothetical protein K443DRAFT_632620 [Laccaria amethystina LaAM-08-1]
MFPSFFGAQVSAPTTLAPWLLILNARVKKIELQAGYVFAAGVAILFLTTSKGTSRRPATPKKYINLASMRSLSFTT